MVFGFYISLSSEIMWFYPISTIHFEEMHFGFKTCIQPFWSIGVNPSKMTIWNFSTSMPFCTKKFSENEIKKTFSEKYKKHTLENNHKHPLAFLPSLTHSTKQSCSRSGRWLTRRSTSTSL